MTDMQNVMTIATSGCVKSSRLGKTFKLNIQCFVVNSICGPYLAVIFWQKLWEMQGNSMFKVFMLRY